MTNFRPVVKAASALLIHTPGLIRYGSKPWREILAQPSHLAELQKRLRTYGEAEGYLPNRVFLGRELPKRLHEIDRPWVGRTIEPMDNLPPFGAFVEEEEFLALLAMQMFLNMSRFWVVFGKM